MKHYIAIVEQEGDSAHSLWFPDVPGCYSAADAASDVLANAVEALQLHLADLDAPEASGAGELAAREDVAECLAAGAWMLAVPFVERDRDASVRINITMPRGVVDAVDSHARTHGLSRSSFLAQAALAAIEGRPGVGSD